MESTAVITKGHGNPTKPAEQRGRVLRRYDDVPAQERNLLSFRPWLGHCHDANVKRPMAFETVAM